MEAHQIVVERLKAYDLSTVPYDLVRSDVEQIMRFACMGMMFHPGKAMIRARPCDDESPFNTRQALQYVPAIKNKRFGRASSPNNTMFYASVIPDELKPSEIHDPRRTATLEVSKILRPDAPAIEEEERMTYSQWIVTQDIILVAICYHQDFIRRSPHTAELYDAYMHFLSQSSPEVAERSLFVTDFFAQQFAKLTASDNEFEYKISAAFADIATANGVGGIYYPTVKDDSLCYNVALAPHIVDSSLRLASAGECTVYKHPCGTIVDNDTVCIISDDSIPFVMAPVEAHRHKGKERVLEELRASCK